MKKIIIISVLSILFSQNDVCFEIESNPNPNNSALECFSKYVNVLDCFDIYAEQNVSDEKVLHVAAVAAELLDNDEDGLANECDDCPDSHLYDTGNFDFSEEFLIVGLDYGYYPSIEVNDVLLLADLVASGDEITPCFVEVSDFTGDNILDVIDVMALANYVVQGN